MFYAAIQMAYFVAVPILFEIHELLLDLSMILSEKQYILHGYSQTNDIHIASSKDTSVFQFSITHKIE